MEDDPLCSGVDLKSALEELICPLCMGTYKEPRSLQCLHSYCESCLTSLRRCSLDQSVVSCPECRTITNLSEQGIKDLPVNFKLKRLVEILTSDQRKELIRKGTKRTSSFKEIQLECTTHDNKPLEYFCDPCGTLICGQCMIDQHRVHGHVRYASEVLEVHIAELKRIVPDAEEVIAGGEQALESLRAAPSRLGSVLNDNLSSVSTYFSNLCQILKEKERDVVTVMKLQARRREKMIQKHLQALSQSVEDMKKSKMLIEDAIENRSKDISVLIDENHLRSKVYASMRLLEEEVLDSNSAGDQFSVITPFKPDPNLEILCRGVGYKTSTPVQTRSHSSLPGSIRRDEHGAPLSPTRERPQTGTFSYKKKSRPPSFTQSNTATFVDKLGDIVPTKLASLRREEIDNILKPVSEIGTRNLVGPYNNVTAYPRGICCNDDGTILVSDARHHLFRIITSTGKCLETVGSEGKGEGQFVEPMSIAVDRAGNILVVDGKNPGRIQKFSIAGKFLSKFKVRGLTSGAYMSEPMGATALYDGRVLVTDGERACVHVFDESGKYQGKFGNLTDLKMPAGIASTAGRIILADKSLHAVFILTIHGQLLARVGKQGTAPGDLSIPYGVAIDNHGNIAVSECGTHRISVFNPGGKFLGCFGVKGSEPGMFHNPRHLYFNNKEQLMVADEQNQRVQLFDLSSIVAS